MVELLVVAYVMITLAVIWALWDETATDIWARVGLVIISACWPITAVVIITMAIVYKFRGLF